MNIKVFQVLNMLEAFSKIIAKRVLRVSWVVFLRESTIKCFFKIHISDFFRFLKAFPKSCQTHFFFSRILFGQKAFPKIIAKWTLKVFNYNPKHPTLQELLSLKLKWTSIIWFGMINWFENRIKLVGFD